MSALTPPIRAYLRFDHAAISENILAARRRSCCVGLGILMNRLWAEMATGRGGGGGGDAAGAR